MRLALACWRIAVYTVISDLGGCDLRCSLLSPRLGGVRFVATLSCCVTSAVGIVLIAPCALCDVSLPVVPQLPQTTTLVITATATDDSGNISSAQTTLTVVHVPSSTTVQHAKSAANGNVVQLSGLVATTSSLDFKGVFYAEHADRSGGIGIMWNGSVSRGDVVVITGIMLTVHGERFVLAQAVQTTPAAP
jgi:hypothetical protein